MNSKGLFSPEDKRGNNRRFGSGALLFSFRFRGFVSRGNFFECMCDSVAERERRKERICATEATRILLLLCFFSGICKADCFLDRDGFIERQGNFDVTSINFKVFNCLYQRANYSREIDLAKDLSKFYILGSV